MKIIKAAAIAIAVLGGAVLAIYAWAASRLAHDALRDGRPHFTRFNLADKPADGTGNPDAAGYLVDSAGRGRVLPPMPPAKPMDIHTAANVQRNLAIHSCFWPGPRARSGVFTNDGNSFHFENQFPDTATTYIPTAFRLPAGGKLVIHGQYPHMRHWNFNTYDTHGVPQDALSDVDIAPDQGSQNPFRAGVSRDVAMRDYTIQVVSGAPTEPRAPNTLYTNAAAGEEVFLWMRNFVPDQSIDYVGGVGLPGVELHQADGTVLKGDAACEATNAPMRGKQLASTVDPRAWMVLTHLPWIDTDNVGARPDKVFPLQAFFQRKQVVLDTFFPALSMKSPEILGGWWSNKATRYGYAYLSRNFGKVYVVTGKLPSTPSSWHGEKDNMPDAQVRYTSFCTAGALSSAVTPDCIYDEQIRQGADQDGRYAIVVSRETDRPANAREACGVSWIEYGNGDGMVSGSREYAMLINRHTMVNPSFRQSWFSVKTPGTEREAMGEYLPYVINMKEKQAFEALGCPIDKNRLKDTVLTAVSVHAG